MEEKYQKYTRTMTVCDNKRRKLTDLQEKTRKWVDLPIELVSLIKSKLFFSDAIRFASVCKNWHLADHITRLVDEPPWAMTFDKLNSSQQDSSKCTCVLYEPKQKSFVVENGTETAKRIEDSNTEVCASKYGWVLFSQKFKDSHETLFFLYSPFSKTTVNLPSLHDAKCWAAATFSSPPTCPDSVVFVLSQPYNQKLMIDICYVRELTWKRYTFDEITKSVHDVIYSKGHFYCVFRGRELASFSIKDHEWRILTEMMLPHRPVRGRVNLVESDEELLLVYLDNYHEECSIFVFSWSRKRWVERKNLGNRVLFLGKCSSISVSAVGGIRKLAKRIYHNSLYSHFKYYSLLDGKIHKDSDYYRWEPRNELAKATIFISPPLSKSFFSSS